MKPRSLLILLSILFFAGGNIINLFFSSNLLWGEMEAAVFAPQADAKKLKLDCPLVIAPSESAVIHARVINTSDNKTTPQVNAFISSPNADARVESQTLQLESLESVNLEWRVDASDVVFERLILISILQRPYRDLPPSQGTCSIYVYSLFGMNGRSTIWAVPAAGVILSILGVALLHYLFHLLEGRAKKLMQVNIVFLVLVLLGLLSSLQRLWGLTLFFNASALLAITVAYVEIIFSKR